MGNFSTNSFPNNRWVGGDTLSDLAEAVQSIDASIRHAFGFSVNALTAPFDIADDGSIVVQTSIAIGTSNAMIDVVDAIPGSPGANEELKLAHVTAIRNFLGVQRLPGENIDLDTSQFNNNLSEADDTAQKAFDTLDDLPLNNLFHFDESDEFSGVSLDSITLTDRIIFEDATDSWGKKYAVVSQLATLVSGYSHTIASHSDTTATGAELETLTDGSETSLHIHDNLYVNLSGDTMTGSLAIGGNVTLDYGNTYIIKDSGGTGRNLLSIAEISGADWCSIGDAYLPVVIRGQATRPSYDDNIGGFEDLALASDLGGYLPLTAGSGEPLTGDLHLTGATPYIVLNGDGTADSKFVLGDNGNAGDILKVEPSGDVDLNIRVVDAAGAGDLAINFMQNTSNGTSGAATVRFYRPDGAGTRVHHLLDLKTGDINFCQEGGDMYVGGFVKVVDTSYPQLILDSGDSGSDFSAIIDDPNLLYLRKQRTAGDVYIDIDHRISDNVSDGFARIFRNTLTSGDAKFQIMVADGTDTPAFEFNAKTGVANLCQQAGTIQQAGVDVALSTDLGDYLPLAGGNMTGNLYLDKTTSPVIYLREGGSITDYVYLDDAAAVGTLAKVSVSGDAVLRLTPAPSDSLGIGAVEFFRHTNTAGSVDLILYRGDGTSTVCHSFESDTGDVDLCQQGGQTTIGGTGGSEKLTVVGDVSIGDGGTTDYAHFDTRGHLQLFGEARVWDDLRAPANTLNLGVTAPTPGTFRGNIRTLLFSDSQDQAVHGDFQLPHKYYEGSDIYVHVHWSPMTTDAGSVVWELEYSWANHLGTFPAPTVITFTDPADGTQYKHQLAPFAAISGTGKEISSVLVYRLRRLGSDGSDTFTGNAALLSVDLHYESDTIGSDEQYTK